MDECKLCQLPVEDADFHAVCGCYIHETSLLEFTYFFAQNLLELVRLGLISANPQMDMMWSRVASELGGVDFGVGRVYLNVTVYPTLEISTHRNSFELN